MERREIIGWALYKRNKGNDPDWPIGVDRLGYHQEPYVKHVPAWEWFYGRSADAVVEALDAVSEQKPTPHAPSCPCRDSAPTGDYCRNPARDCPAHRSRLNQQLGAEK